MAGDRPPCPEKPQPPERAVSTTPFKFPPFLLLVAFSILSAILLSSRKSAEVPFPSPPYVLFSTRVLLPGHVVAPAAISVDSNGRISDVVRVDTAEIAKAAARSQPFIDVAPLVIMPGLVDPHVHANQPGKTHWEGFASATRAAAAGGTTTMLDMPLNSVPSTVSMEFLAEKANALADSSASPIIDVGLIAGILPSNHDEIGHLYRAGVLAFKSFMVDSQSADFPHVTVDDMAAAMKVLSSVMQENDPTGLSFFPPYMLHAELPPDAKDATEHYPGSDTSYTDYLASRPESWEVDAVDAVLRHAADTRCRVHIAHVSSSEAAGRIADFIGSDANKNGDSKYNLLTGETCPHYLLFSSDTIPPGRPQFKCSPPIRSSANRDRLWELIGNLGLSMITSDHSPVEPSMKLVEIGDVRRAWGGISGLQYRLQATWSAAIGLNKGKLSSNALIAHVGEALSTVPARVFGLGGAKGSIAVGRDADFVIWNPEKAVLVTEEDCWHRHQFSVFIGMNLTGVIHRTIVRGRTAFSAKYGVPEDAGSFGKVLLRESGDGSKDELSIETRGLSAQSPGEFASHVAQLRSK